MRSKLKQARNKAGLNQDQVADKIGITKHYVSFLENGAKHPSLYVAFQLAELYNVNIDEFGIVKNAFQHVMRKIPLNNMYFICDQLGIVFDKNGIFKEDN